MIMEWPLLNKDTTEQEVFNTVVRHLRKQGCKAMARENNPDGVFDAICKYRLETDDGTVLKCAAGCLIPDEAYEDSLENRGWITLIVHKKVPGFHSNLIVDLQCVHDNHPVREWEGQLELLAVKYNLTMPIFA
jgi:hypothetical protein